MGSKKTAGRRAATAQNEFTQLGIDQLAPFLQAGAEQLPGLATGATVGGLDERIGELLGSDTFSNLIGGRERAVQGQLAAGGLTRSGAGLEAAAAVPQELALQLEQLLTGRSQGLAAQGLGAGSNIASLFANQGEAASSGIVTDAQAKASAFGNILDIGSKIFFASDERLKENIVHISTVGDTKIYEWDWIPEVKGTFIESHPTTGVISQEVVKTYPEYVADYKGWLVVDYAGLMGRLQSNLDEKIAREAA